MCSLGDGLLSIKNGPAALVFFQHGLSLLPGGMMSAQPDALLLRVRLFVCVSVSVCICLSCLVCLSVYLCACLVSLFFVPMQHLNFRAFCVSFALLTVCLSCVCMSVFFCDSVVLRMRCCCQAARRPPCSCTRYVHSVCLSVCLLLLDL